MFRCSYIYAFICFILFSPFANASWKSVDCKTADDPDFIKIEQGSDGRYHVETRQTRRFLIGLNCDFPLAGEPVFYCKGSGSQYGDITLSSVLVHEVGYPKDSYGRIVDYYYYVFHLSFPYEDSNGEYKQAERTWKFNKSDCEAGAQ
jgi:hypothetical protein